MKYFKQPDTGIVFAYESDGTQDDYILPGLVLMTATEIEAHLNPVIPVTVPAAITRRQARLALLGAGKLADVEAAISAIADPVQKMAAQIEYENATWERSNAWVDQLGAAVGLTPADIDQLFITAASL